MDLDLYRKRPLNKLSLPKKLKLNNTYIEYSKSMKYLGIHLDSRLRFTYHLEQKIKSARKLLMITRNAVHAQFGPSPRALKWAYSALVLSSLCYGSCIWARAAQTCLMQKKLSKLNRLMALSMANVRRSTPTTALECILGLVPIDISIKERALLALSRILPHNTTRWSGLGRIKSTGHLRWGLDIFHELEISHKIFDRTSTINLNKNYNVDIESFRSGQPITESNTVVYTDGSKIADGNCGYGFGIFQNNYLIAEESGQLGKYNSVFQGEVMAISKAAETLYELLPQMCALERATTGATLFSDSQAALASLVNLKVKSKTVKTCIDNLNLIASDCAVHLKYVKAHLEWSGNHFADFCARQGTTTSTNRLDIPMPISWVKQKITNLAYKIWTNRWFSIKEARQTKLWIQKPNKVISNFMINCNRKDLSLVCQMITGHNFLNRHENVINQAHNPTCRLCNDGEESSWHIFGECPALWRKRLEAFGHQFLDNYPKWKPSQFLKFLSNSGLSEMNKRVGTQLVPTL